MKIIMSIVFAVLIFFAFSLSLINAEESQFRKRFIENYRNNKFEAQVSLVKQNKDTIPSEIGSLITEAMTGDKNYNERINLLDIASTMAVMHSHWNGGSAELSKKIELLKKEELEKHKKRKEDHEKRDEVEKVPGNFILERHREELSSKGMSPVVYPHWVHRSFFRCKVCHENIFIMKRGANDISHTAMQEGKFCGRCHNGKLSFDAAAQNNCTRCHVFGKPESIPLIDLTYYKSDKFKEVASRLGAEWNPENLPGGRLPLDKLGFINWVELDRIKAFKPLSSLDGSEDTDGVRETSILFETSVTFLKDVLFSHKLHSTWVKCSMCHPKAFKSELGANRVKMIEMKEGKSCGLCHGKVAFTYSDCLRCHNQSRENPPQGALINRATTSANTQ